MRIVLWLYFFLLLITCKDKEEIVEKPLHLVEKYALPQLPDSIHMLNTIYDHNLGLVFGYARADKTGAVLETGLMRAKLPIAPLIQIVFERDRNGYLPAIANLSIFKNMIYVADYAGMIHVLDSTLSIQQTIDVSEPYGIPDGAFVNVDDRIYFSISEFDSDSIKMLFFAHGKGAVELGMAFEKDKNQFKDYPVLVACACVPEKLLMVIPQFQRHYMVLNLGTNSHRPFVLPSQIPIQRKAHMHRLDEAPALHADLSVKRNSVLLHCALKKNEFVLVGRYWKDGRRCYNIIREKRSTGEIIHYETSHMEGQLLVPHTTYGEFASIEDDHLYLYSLNL